MTAQIRAELLKVRSTRTTIGLALGMIGLILLFSLLTGLASTSKGLTGRAHQLELLNIGNLAGAFSAIAGVLLVTSEYRYGTIRPTLLFTPARSRTLAAKLVAATLTGAAFAVAGGGLRLGDLRDPEKPWHPFRADQRRHRDAGSRRAQQRRRDLGRDRRRPRRDHPQPGGRHHHDARLGLRCRQPALWDPTVGRPLHAHARPGRPIGMRTAHLLSHSVGALASSHGCSLLATIGLSLNAKRDIT